MRILLRLTCLGVFAAIGLALAVSVAMQTPPEPPPTHDSVAPPVAKKSASETIQQTQIGIVKPTISTELPPPISRDEVREILNESIDRWTASYVPAMTRQYKELEAAQKATQEAAEQLQAQARQNAGQLPAQPNSEQTEKAKTEVPPPRPPVEEPPARSTAPAAGSLGATAPEVQRNAQKDLVSVTAPNSDIREVLKTLSDATGLNILATPSVTGSVSVSLNDVALEDALTAILRSSGYSSRREKNFIYIGTVEEIQNLSTSNDSVGTRVYRPNYVTATELQKLLTPMLSKSVGTVAVSTTSQVGITSSKDSAGGDSYAGSEVVLVRDFDTVLCQMDQVFEEVDRMPAQVAIEAMILSVRLNDADTLGVDFELLRNKANIRLVSGSTVPLAAETLSGATAAAIAGSTLNFQDGLKVGFLDESLFAFVDALETIGDTNVIASPHVMCLNKQRAEILIGSELGYMSTTVTETAATQSVEFLEVGTNLKIRPFISNDGMVRLEVHPELSTGIVQTRGGLTLPEKETTQVTTNIMCRSGATVIIGGLIREDLVTTSTQIPVLGNLPLLGALFRQRTDNTERREIIVLLTPRIVGEPDMYAEAAHAATQVRDRRNAFYDKMQPINKRRIGEQYFRLALSAWAAMDADMALRYANLSIHYDPLYQAAIDLRQEILAMNPGLEGSVTENLKYGLCPWQHPLYDYSAPTNWPWRAVGPVEEAPAFPQPPDTGHSGQVRNILSGEHSTSPAESESVETLPPGRPSARRE